ncbi:MAG: hypothetical protein IJ789_05715 [Bacteroidales bacterium]|nr:hypothetical protein [Bacteroidales bacterium]
MSNTLIEPFEDADVLEMQDDLTSEERAYWEDSIKRDMREIAEGKQHEHYPIEDLRTHMLGSLSKQYA